MQDRVTKLFKAIADPTRREIFHALVVASTALSITQIASDFAMTRQGVTKHIKTLEDAGLIYINNVGRERFCNADPKPLKEVDKWLQSYSKFWDDKLDNLEKFLGQKHT
ncbi:metalloregulator ArsR/SmtB family transcription factor [Winogradskyella sp. 3972H.M.0a.05]|uniref:ArsR/SmtB family transcription factor n=1 Tax=Winogradskyella sp. 3972H.M.0a.05 TaxID=2950277 RepID=UPI0033941952